MALPLATTELPTCNHSLVIKRKNGVCQNRATPFWAADNSPRLAICSAALTSGTAAFLLLLVLVVSLWLLLFPSRPSPLPWSSCLLCSRLFHSNVTAPERRGESRCSSCHIPGGTARLTSFLQTAFVGWLWGSLGGKGHGQVWPGVGDWPVSSRGNRTFQLWAGGLRAVTVQCNP